LSYFFSIVKGSERQVPSSPGWSDSYTSTSSFTMYINAWLFLWQPIFWPKT